ncbi:hypothetical protein [Planctomicrobium piriforme]|uniref:Uncharacterized protein n=1 Tax=Planctomicrobium piriforme TaxID=1576369 RepID=A0A1I3EE02_9PLAN|nr:hypothetical protein [Planctomicrobium piriforme]SFH97220.1 hypothetical protein SAMN05421753_104183 [Planctomicrobium piriforme]
MNEDTETLLTSAITDANAEANPNAPATIDPLTILAIITALLNLIRGCQSQASARAQIKKGGLIAKHQIRRALKDSGYKGDDWKMARSLAAKGSAMDASQLDQLIGDVADIAVPSSGPWPVE